MRDFIIRKRRTLLLLLFLFAALFLFSAVFSVLREPKATEANVSITLDTLPSSLKDLFTDYTQTRLSEAYDTMEELSALKEQVGVGAGNKVFFDRAEDVIRGKVAYEPDREFSTKANAQNRIEQYGDKSAYSRNVLKLDYVSSDLMITGIYGMTNDKISVYVEADPGAYLPSLIITQHQGYYSSYRDRVYLSRGKNTFTYSDLSSGSSQSVKGGAIYILNPYTSESQNGQVSLYIEGGGFYPTYQKGEDEQRFLNILEEYETRRLAHPKTMPNMAELETDHVMFTLESSVLYQEYIAKKSITPSENLRLWAEYFKKVFEFNGIATSSEASCGHYDQRNDSVKINLRLMSAIANSGAYATNYHIGFYSQSEWFANYNYAKDAPSTRYTFDIGHELGHALDVSSRVLHETTNNVNAAFTYVDVLGKGYTSQFFPFDKAIKYMGSDYSLQNAFDDGYILYQDRSNHDHNYLVWWYLESVFPGYWGKLNNMFRYEDTLSGANSVERMVYYSSLVTGVDLSEYFDRWGVYLANGRKFSIGSASSAYQNAVRTAIEEKKISSDAGHYWYVDSSEYGFMRNHQTDSDRSYKGSEPVITSITESNGVRKITIGGRPDANLLGYEILSKTNGGDYKIAGFSYLSTFTDENKYSSEPTYKVVAINRFFSSAVSEEVSGTNGSSSDVPGVCRVNGKNYSTLSDAIDAAKTTSHVVELLSDCNLGNKDLYQDITLKVADDVKNNISITCSGKTYMVRNLNNLKLQGREDARIILTGGASLSTYSIIFASTNTLSAEYVTFRGCKSDMFAGAIYSVNADVELRHCQFENCSSGGDSDAIYMSGNKLTLEDCTFAGQNVDVYFAATPNLTLVKSVPQMKIGRKEFSAVEIRTEDYTPNSEDCKKLSFEDSSVSASLKNNKLMIGGIEYQLTFKASGKTATYKATSSRFVFGEETISFLREDEYCSSYRDQSGNHYKIGEAIDLSGDMQFEVTLAKKNKLTLRFMGNKERGIDFIGEKGVYLPRFDDDKKIVLWVSDTASYYAGEMFHASKDETLTAVYLDYFLYRYMNHGKCESYGYEQYGNTIAVNRKSDKDFRGWFSDGKLVTDSLSITKNTLLTAIYQGDTFDLSEAKITVPDCVYTGEPQRPRIVVELDGQILSEDFYTVGYSDNINVGTAKVKITARGDIAKNGKEATFQIIKALPFTRPSETIRVGSSTETVKGVSLPDGWTWKNPDQKLKTGENKVIAVYFDRDNFTDTEVEITIIREDNLGGGTGTGGSGGSGTGGSGTGGSGTGSGGSDPQNPQRPEEDPQNPQHPEEDPQNPQRPEEDPDLPQEEEPQDPDSDQDPQLPEEGENPEDPTEPDEGSEQGKLPGYDPEEGNRSQDPIEEPDPGTPDQEPGDAKNPQEQNPGDSASSGSRPGDSADTGNHAGGITDSGDVEKGGNMLWWLLIIPAVLIPAGIVLFIILKKRKNG